MKPGTIRARVLLAVFGSFLVAIGAVVFTTHLAWKRTIHLVGSQSLEAARSGLANLEASDSRTLEATLEALMANEKLQETFLSRDPEKLRALAAPFFERLRREQDITHWYFIDPDGTCFLRVHDPALRGDRIERATLKAAAASGHFGTGKELGKTAFALRVVHPWTDSSGKLLGYMELGQEIDHFLDLLKKQTGSDYGLLVDKKSLDHENWTSMRKAAGKADDWDAHADVVVAGATSRDERLIRFDGSIAGLAGDGEVIDVTERDGKAWVRGVVPMLDAAGHRAGAVYVLDDVTDVLGGMKQVRLRIILILSALMVLLGLFLSLLLQRLVFARLDHAIEVATRVVGGDWESRIPVSADDEVGRLESLLEQFRQVFVNTLHELHPASRNDPKK